MRLSKNEIELLVTLVVNDGKLSASEIFNNRDILSKFNLVNSLSSANSSEDNAKWVNDVLSEARREVQAKCEHHKNRDAAEQLLRGDKQNLNYLIDERMGPIAPNMINMLYDIIKGGGRISQKDLANPSALRDVGLDRYMNSVEGYSRVTQTMSDGKDKDSLSKQISALRDMVVDKARRTLYRGDYYKVDWKAEQRSAQQQEQQRPKGIKL